MRSDQPNLSTVQNSAVITQKLLAYLNQQFNIKMMEQIGQCDGKDLNQISLEEITNSALYEVLVQNFGNDSGQNSFCRAVKHVFEGEGQI